MHFDWKLSRDELERNYDVYVSYKKLDQDRKNKMSENKSIFKYIEVGRYTNILNDINAFLSTQYRANFEDFYLADESENPLNRAKKQVVDAMSPYVFNQSPTTFSTIFSFNRNVDIHTRTKSRINQIKY